MVELKKDLPEIFEEFADQRRNSFLAIKKLKEQGVPVVGAFCTYLPKELPRAMGAAVVGLCSVSDETIPDAEKEPVSSHQVQLRLRQDGQVSLLLLLRSGGGRDHLRRQEEDV